jgi:hypothetical protein
MNAAYRQFVQRRRTADLNSFLELCRLSPPPEIHSLKEAKLFRAIYQAKWG